MMIANLFFVMLLLLPSCVAASGGMFPVPMVYVAGGGGGLTQVILRPTSDGIATSFTPSAGARWEAVNDVTANGDTDYIYTSSTGMYSSFYSTTTVDTGGTITDVKVKFNAKTATAAQTRCLIRIGSTWYQQNYDTMTTSYADYTCTYTLNPATSSAWTPADVNALQFGIVSYGTITGELRATQVYAEVNGSGL